MRTNKTLRIYKSIDKQNYVTLKDNSCWRVYHYIENSISIDKTIELLKENKERK